MIPILYSETENNFTSNGIGRLADAISCTVTEVRNGEYTLSMVYPESGQYYSELKVSRYIKAVPSDGTTAQPFRIYKISKPLNGRVSISAEHRSYQLSMIPCGPFTAANVSSALQGLKTNAYETCNFTFWTDKSTVATYKQVAPASIRSRLGGVQGSILDTYGGEYEFDNLTVKLHGSRGSNRGVTLRYGKNITDINQEINIENTITGICPYVVDPEGNMIMLPEHVVYSPNASNFPEPRDAVIDFSTEFQNTTPTAAQLRAKVQAYIAANNIGVPAVNIKVSFVALWQTEEYKDIANLERVKLCDTVTVYFEKLGIEATAKVIKTEYNVLKDRYNSIELGEARTDLASQIASINAEIQEKPSSSAMQQAINAATKLITGGLGGHVVFNLNADGEPEEILIMDTDDTSTAVNVIRMNKNGIGFSTNGYNGPFTTAWTIDGSFVADFITAGTLRAINIEGVSISGSTLVSSNTGNTRSVTIQNGWIDCKAPASADGTTGISMKNGSQKFTVHASNIYGVNPSGVETIWIGNNAYGWITLYDENGVGGLYLTPSKVQLPYFESSGSTTKIKDSNQTATISMEGNNGSITCRSFLATGTKSRLAETKSFGDRLLYCYETPTPYFGDIGEGRTDEDGKCYVFLDDVFAETLEGKYQVFIQAYGVGRFYVSERTPSYFVVEGEPNTAFGWELKAPQNGYGLNRLETFEEPEQEETDILVDTMNYLTSQLYNVEGESA